MKARIRQQNLYNELLAVAERLFAEIRNGQGQFQTGSCRIDDKTVLIINTRQSLDERIASISREIVTVGTEDIYLKPSIRAELERLQITAQQEQ